MDHTAGLCSDPIPVNQHGTLQLEVVMIGLSISTSSSHVIMQDRVTLWLSHFRLAPIQLASYGQPVSTHGAQIDYWLAGEAGGHCRRTVSEAFQVDNVALQLDQDTTKTSLSGYCYCLAWAYCIRTRNTTSGCHSKIRLEKT